MSIRLVLEHTPHRQAVMEMEFHGGQLVIGRGDDADWKLTDPDMFVSRQHAILTEEDGQVMVTDASSGGLFIDNAANPVGAGNAVPIDPGMRLRLGDFVMRVEHAGDAAQPAPQTARGGLSMSFDFGPAPEPDDTPKERPADLPDPFGFRSNDRVEKRQEDEKRPPRPLDQDDPFGLDLRGAFGTAPKVEQPPEPDPDEGAGGGYFGGAPSRAAPETTPEPEPTGAPERKPLFGGSPFDAPADESRNHVRGTEPPRPPEDPPAVAPAPEPAPPVPEPEPPRAAPEPAPPPQPAPAPPPSAPVATTADAEALRAALYRGLGLDPAHFPTDNPEAEMEAIGARMRELVDGLMLLLRTRAQEKQKVRVAQTIISSANVNPLKFLATTDEALSALIQPRGQGYLPPDQAVTESYRDLTDHSLRTWSALQTSLRRMIDRFDPEAIEAEMADTGFLESLIAGGRSAKLWQLYEERYRDIAKSAEEQFLGEVGADFRDAYENQRSS